MYSNAAFKSSGEAPTYEFESRSEMLLSDWNKMYFIFNFLTNTMKGKRCALSAGNDGKLDFVSP